MPNLKKDPGSGAMRSKVGNRQIYQNDDQRTSKASKKPSELIMEESQQNSHDIHNTQDSRSISNRAAAKKKNDRREEARRIVKAEGPRMPALRQGHQPGKGAQIDTKIMADKQKELKRKGKV